MGSPTLPTSSYFSLVGDSLVKHAKLSELPASHSEPWDDTIASNTPDSQFSYSQRRQTMTNLKLSPTSPKSLFPIALNLKSTLSKAAPFLGMKQRASGSARTGAVKRQTLHARHHDVPIEQFSNSSPHLSSAQRGSEDSNLITLLNFGLSTASQSQVLQLSSLSDAQLEERQDGRHLSSLMTFRQPTPPRAIYMPSAVSVTSCIHTDILWHDPIP